MEKFISELPMNYVTYGIGTVLVLLAVYMIYRLVKVDGMLQKMVYGFITYLENLNLLSDDTVRSKIDEFLDATIAKLKSDGHISRFDKVVITVCNSAFFRTHLINNALEVAKNIREMNDSEEETPAK